MKRFSLFTLFVMLLFVVAVAFGNVPNYWGNTKTAHENPWLDWTGGPDAYGYTALDTQAPGGPAYLWKDITGIGTQVTGLGDDNYVGPFSIGFNFNYYWYTRNQVYIGSNGYLKFPPAYNIASPFPTTIPLTANPNDYLAVYTGDLDFTVGGTCYRWTNNVDTFIVSWINLPAWNTPGSSHTFQVILSGNNNKIRMQYGAQTGGMGTNNDDIIGIENVNGQLGILRFTDQLVTANYAILYNRPDSTTYTVHDYEANAVMNLNSQAFFNLQGTAYTPVVWVKNVGNQPETGGTVNCQIKTMTGTVLYNQTVNLSPMTPGQLVQITYGTAWTPTTTGQYSITETVTLTGDMNTTNNTKAGEIEVVTFPGEYAYDDNVANYSTAWNGATGGFGMKFTPPQYPVTVTQVKVYIGTISAAPQTFTAQLVDDNGPDGAPGTVLFQQVITASTQNSWYTANCNVNITSGSFYGAWQQSGQTTTNCGIDTTSPRSRQTWEYTNGWAPYRDVEVADAMIRVYLSGPISVNLTLSPINPPIVIPAIGGTFSYDIAVQNTGGSPITFGIWNMVTLPTGANYGPVWGPFSNLPLAAGQTISRTRTQGIPGTAPSGQYNYRSYVGSYPSVIWDSASFTFTKSATMDGGKGVSEWSSWGEAFPGENLTIIGETPTEFTLDRAYPNPFNPVTHIAFSLPLDAKARLAVFDIEGNEVATLVDGYIPAGEYTAVFDGTNLASGVYFCRLTAGDFTATQKLLLLK